MSKITLHHLENSRSQRLLWMLEELELEYNLVKHQRNAETQFAPADLKAIHPLGKAPLLLDGEQVLAESGVMVEYLRDVYADKQWAFGEGSQEQLQERYWVHFSEGSLMPYLVMQLVFNRIRNAPMPWIARKIAKRIAGEVEKSFLHPNLETQFTYINNHLSNKTWFVGERLSLADIMMSFPLEAAMSRFNQLADAKTANETFSHIVAFIQRVQARPAYQRALDKGGEYDYLLK